MSSPTLYKPVLPPFIKNKTYFQKSFVLSSVLYLKDVDIQQIISLTSFKSFPSNHLCLHTEVKLGCLVSHGCAKLMLLP